MLKCSNLIQHLATKSEFFDLPDETKKIYTQLNTDDHKAIADFNKAYTWLSTASKIYLDYKHQDQTVVRFDMPTRVHQAFLSTQLEDVPEFLATPKTEDGWIGKLWGVDVHKVDSPEGNFGVSIGYKTPNVGERKLVD